ncbi:MAG: hypothetical protein JWN76_2458 [Chitinophagaceae bacterium]|nr:hypothetical protein [Chitinophagaceae bacterium]
MNFNFFRNKRKKSSLTFFLSLQDRLVQQLDADRLTWQQAIVHAENEYGYNKGAYAFFNAFAFYRLSFLDIILLYKAFHGSKETLEKKLYAKMLALHLYEFIQDIPSIFGKPFANDLTILLNHELGDELAIIKRNIKDIKSSSLGYLKEIRNTVAGHKDANTFKQIEIIESINYDKIDAICLCIYGIYLQINKFEKNIRDAIKEQIGKKGETKNE